jgi:hypothetical protein
MFIAMNRFQGKKGSSDRNAYSRTAASQSSVISCIPADAQNRHSPVRTFHVTETSNDRDTMGRLAKALAFISGPNNPVTVALKTAAETGTERDIKNARKLFLKLKPGDRQAALKMIED